MNIVSMERGVVIVVVFVSAILSVKFRQSAGLTAQDGAQASAKTKNNCGESLLGPSSSLLQRRFFPPPEAVALTLAFRFGAGRIAGRCLERIVPPDDFAP